MKRSFFCRLILPALMLAGSVCLASGDEVVPPLTDETVTPTTLPTMVHRAEPSYPASARQAGITGNVWIRALVDRDGQVAKAEVSGSSGNTDLDEAALTAARKCRYLPARQGSEAVEIWVSYCVEFKLDDCPPPGENEPGTPELIHQPLPVYPDAAKRAGLEGEIHLKILVAADGSVSKVEVAKSSCRDCGFAEAAVAAARQYRFRPISRDSSPDGTWVAQTVRFRLE